MILKGLQGNTSRLLRLDSAGSGYSQVEGLLFVILGHSLQSEDGFVERYVAYIGTFKWVKTCNGEQLDPVCKTKVVLCTTLKYLPTYIKMSLPIPSLILRRASNTNIMTLSRWSTFMPSGPWKKAYEIRKKGFPIFIVMPCNMTPSSTWRSRRWISATESPAVTGSLWHTGCHISSLFYCSF
jgi:hypothetical protein